VIIKEGNVMRDHVHRYFSIPPKYPVWVMLGT